MSYDALVIIKLTSGELAELMQYDGGPFGEKGFAQFMAGICARIDESSGEVDIDRDDLDKITTYSHAGHKRVLEKIFKRAVDDALRRFLG
jgi:hypothetical protein